MRIEISQHFKKKLKRFERKSDPKIREKIKKTVKLLEKGEIRKGIRLHKVIIRKGEVWSISIDMKTRLIFSFIEDGIILVDLGSHKEVYN